MGRLLVFILGAAIVLGGAYYYLNSPQGRARVEGAEAQSERMLENVRGAAGRIESDAQKKVDRILEER